MTNHSKNLLTKITIYDFHNCYDYAYHYLVFHITADFSLFSTYLLKVIKIHLRNNFM